jgi:hypothetical protein
MTLAPPAPRRARHKDGKTPDLIYGFDEETQSYFHHHPNRKPQHCLPEEFLQVTEPYDLPETDRGAILLGIPLD